MKNIIKYVLVGATFLGTCLFAADSTKTNPDSLANPDSLGKSKMSDSATASATAKATAAYSDSVYLEVINLYQQLLDIKNKYEKTSSKLSKKLSPKIDAAIKKLEAVFENGATPEEVKDFLKAYGEVDSVLKSEK